MVEENTHLAWVGAALSVHWAVLGAVRGAEATETIPQGLPLYERFMSLARDEIVFLEAGNSSWALAPVDGRNWNNLVSSRTVTL